jgi:hypothetical protein
MGGVGAGGLRQHVAAADQDQLGARAGHGHVQPLGLEKELGHLEGKGQAGGGEGDQHDLALLALHALDRVDDDRRQGRFVLEGVAQEAADQPALGAVGHDHTDLVGRDAVPQQRQDQLDDGIGFLAAAHGGVGVAQVEEHGRRGGVEDQVPGGMRAGELQAPHGTARVGLQSAAVEGLVGPLDEDVIEPVGDVEQGRIGAAGKGVEDRIGQGFLGGKDRHRRELVLVAEEDVLVPAEHAHDGQGQGDLGGLVEQHHVKFDVGQPFGIERKGRGADGVPTGQVAKAGFGEALEALAPNNVLRPAAVTDFARGAGRPPGGSC